MYIQGTNYWLTKHGRMRFKERVGEVSDNEILQRCAVGDVRPRAVWKPEINPVKKVVMAYRLVTVLLEGAGQCIFG